MTWSSSGVRSLNILLVLPLVVTRFEAAEIALWYLFTALIQLQLLADFGFSPTFVRVFSYAKGGLGVESLADQRRPNAPTRPDPNWEAVGLIWSTVRTVYGRLTLGACAGLLLFGTPFVYGPILETESPEAGFLAWGVILCASLVILRGNSYAAYLNGLDHVALVRRWEGLVGLAAILTQAAVLVGGGGVLALTIAHQSWMVFNVLRNWLLARWVEGGVLKTFDESTDPRVLAAVWPSAWRSGVGVALGTLPLPLTGMLFAQLASPVRSAQYLLSINVLGSIRGFAMAPFYSRLPLMARLRGQARLDELAAVARRGMLWSYWTFAALHIGMGVVGGSVLALLGANSTLVPLQVWAAFGLAMLAERYGAMHLHLYSTTNDVLWHVANGVSAVVIVLAAVLAYPAIEILAFPLAILCAYVLFYVPYIVPRSLTSVRVSWRAFDLPALSGPLIVMAGFTAFAFLAS